MKKEDFDTFKKELVYIVIAFALFAVAMQIIFYKESFLVVLRMSFSVFWLCAIPGYSLMYFWRESLDLAQRIVIGSALSLAVVAVFSYQLGLLGINIKYHWIVFPVILTAAGIAANYRVFLKN